MELKDEKERNILFPQCHRKNHTKRGISGMENLRGYEPKKAFKGSFPVVRTNSIEFIPKSFITIGIKLGLKEHFLDSDDDENLHEIDSQLEEIARILNKTIKRVKDPVTNIGRYMDILYQTNYSLANSFQITNYQDITISSIYYISVNTEYCIIPIDLLASIEDDFPEITKIYINFLGRMANIMGVLEINHFANEWISIAYDNIQETLENEDSSVDKDEKLIESLEQDIWNYGPIGTVTSYEKRIKKAYLVYDKIRDFKPIHPIEKLLYDWIMEFENILNIGYSLDCFDYYDCDEEGYPPVTIGDCCRFVWSFDDSYYNEFNSHMQTHAQEGGIQEPTIVKLLPEQIHETVDSETAFLTELCDLMRKGRDIYYDITEREDYVKHKSTIE